MDNKNDCTKIASTIANEMDKLNPLNCNIAAMLTAQILCEGKDKCELQDLLHFLQLLSTAIKTYIC